MTTIPAFAPARRRPLRWIQPVAVLFIAALTIGIPLWLVAVTSAKPQAEAIKPNLSLPHHVQAAANYQQSFDEGKIVQGFVNSLLVVAPSVVIVLLLGAGAAWVFARRKGRLVNAMYALSISGLLLPPAVITIVMELRQLGLAGTRPGMIGVYAGMYLSTSIFFMTGFIRALPEELEEAARMDGAGPLRVFLRIILPLLRPVIATATIMVMLFAWSDIFYAFFVLGGGAKATLPLNLYQVANAQLYLNNWHLIFAYVVMMSLPMVLVFVNWTYRATAGASVSLTAGTHTLTLAKGTNEVTLDKIDLTAASGAETVYPAAYTDITGKPSYDYSASGTTGAGALALKAGSSAAFDVYAPADGYYTVHTDYASDGAAKLTLDGATAVSLPSTRGRLTDKSTRLYLSAGNNRVTAATSGSTTLTLRDLRVAAKGDTSGVTAYEAEDGTLAGDAVVASDSWASGGSYVGYIGNGSGNTLTVKVDAADAGRYVMNVRYANNQVAGSGNYNTNVVSRAARISVNGTAQTVMFRNNYSWSSYWDLPVPVTLAAGTNTITFANTDAYAPNIDRVTVAPLTG
ncbi:hypothetical protein SALBM311S_00823 [Streptomyces alboniger]